MTLNCYYYDLYSWTILHLYSQFAQFSAFSSLRDHIINDFCDYTLGQLLVFFCIFQPEISEVLRKRIFAS